MIRQFFPTIKQSLPLAYCVEGALTCVFSAGLWALQLYCALLVWR